jgi:hypothetical protein
MLRRSPREGVERIKKIWSIATQEEVMASITKAPPGSVIIDTTGMGEDRMLDAQRSGFGVLSFLMFPMIAIAAIVIALYELIPS